MRKAYRIGLIHNIKHHVLSKSPTNKCKEWNQHFSSSLKKMYLQAPLRRPLSDFSNAAFVSSLKTEVKSPCCSPTGKKGLQNIVPFCIRIYNKMIGKWTERTFKENSAELTWMSSGCMKDNSPIIPPWTLADETPIKQTITQIPI